MVFLGWVIFVLAVTLPAPGFADKVTITLDFSKGDLDYPYGFQLTDQYEDQGILFIGGSQENVVVSGYLDNPHIAFLKPVREVIVVLEDSNFNPQTHTLLAYDISGQLIDQWKGKVLQFGDNELTCTKPHRWHALKAIFCHCTPLYARCGGIQH
jgi:hypothetical protein